MRPSDAASSAAKSFSTAFAALVTSDDVIGTLTNLMLGCVASVGAESAGLVVAVPGQEGRLELLASTSHRAEELALYQLQSGDGPCVDAVRLRQPILASGYAEIAARWPDLKDAFVGAGYRAVHATALRWRDESLGALNVFWSGVAGPASEDTGLIRGFADVATIAILHAGWISPAHLVERTWSALAGRAVIEQAKGALAYHRNLDQAAAFDALIALARDRSVSLSAAAAEVLDDAGRPIG